MHLICKRRVTSMSHQMDYPFRKVLPSATECSMNTGIRFIPNVSATQPHSHPSTRVTHTYIPW
jgi:hypothetical protein